MNGQVPGFLQVPPSTRARALRAHELIHEPAGTREPDGLLWRAVAEHCYVGDADPNWRGRWQSRAKAVKQAQRWWASSHDIFINVVYIESTNGDIEDLPPCP